MLVFDRGYTQGMTFYVILERGVPDITCSECSCFLAIIHPPILLLYYLGLLVKKAALAETEKKPWENLGLPLLLHHLA